MNDPKSSKSPRPGASPAPRPAVPSARAAVPGSSSGRPAPAPASRGDTDELPTGKVVHDDRGNAVWDWMKNSGRHAIESTSRLLRKLELPELKFEDPKDEELRVMPDPSTGGGYDPYNQATKPTRKVLKK
jgi:hypothetical protein